MQDIKFTTFLTVLFVSIITFSFLAILSVDNVETAALPASDTVVLIDAGHGGFDPGTKSGNTLEKDINIAIAKFLQGYLEIGGATVVLTRADDTPVASNKQSDMYMRKEISNTSQVDIVVSIHQNYYEDSSVDGPQVFYFEGSEESKKLAECIQYYLNKLTGEDNEPVGITTYYVLRTTIPPAVIVECGFLSNYEECQKLKSAEYQQQVAWAIYCGIVSYFYGSDIL